MKRKHPRIRRPITNPWHLRIQYRHWYDHDPITGELVRLSSLSMSLNTNRIPSKKGGRRGTRKGWKREMRKIGALWQGIFE